MSVLGQEYQECWCIDCGHRQKTDHLGTQNCKRCGKRNWLDIHSWEKMINAQKSQYYSYLWDAVDRAYEESQKKVEVESNE